MLLLAVCAAACSDWHVVKSQGQEAGSLCKHIMMYHTPEGTHLIAASCDKPMPSAALHHQHQDLVSAIAPDVLLACTNIKLE